MAILLLMPEGDGKPEPTEIDPAKIEQLLNIELMQKRAAWQQARAKRNNLRALSFIFLFLVIVAALLAFFFVFSSGVADRKPSTTEDSPSPTTSPY